MKLCFTSVYLLDSPKSAEQPKLIKGQGICGLKQRDAPQTCKYKLKLREDASLAAPPGCRRRAPLPALYYSIMNDLV